MKNTKLSDTISRHEFFKKLGLGGAALMAVYFSGTGLTSCSNESVSPSGSTSGIDFTLNLDDSSNLSLKTNGGYIISQGVVVARTNAGDYVAVTRTCSHEGLQQIIYQTDHFYCTVHGAEYDNSGKGLNANGSKGIAVYNTSLTNNLLRVYSGT
jgi:nitrite reductase/ring-hydroxylating ferredoxin subunit